MSSIRLFRSGVLALLAAASAAAVAPDHPASGSAPAPGEAAASRPILGALAPQPAQVLGGLEIENMEDPLITDVRLGPGDEIGVTVYRHDDLSRTLHVPPSGVVFFPLVGEIRVKNMGMREFRKLLTDGLAKYILDPQVSLEVKASQGQKIVVLGEVKTPGVFHIQEPTSTIEAISLAGGFTNDADLRDVYLVRGGLSGQTATVARLDVKSLLRAGAVEQNPVLKGGEMLYVTATKLENTARFFDRMWRIVRPMVFAEQGVVLFPEAREAALHGTTTKSQRIVIVPAP
jgi:polysaccharide biosynthesis/export protein